jgi:predicted membrane-bound spermidine synthase
MREMASGTAAQEGSPPSDTPLPVGRARPILLLAGVNLTLVHYVTLTEFAALVGSNELVALLALTAYFTGVSLGYLYSNRLGRRALEVIGLGTLALHATLPFSARWVAGTFARINLAGNTPPFIFLLVALGITPFYAVFLPRLIAGLDRGSDGAAPPLVKLYATEIAGGAAGLLLTVVLTPARLRWILTIYLAVLVALLVLLATRRRALRAALLAPIPIVYALCYPSLNLKSIAYYYEWAHDFGDPHMLASELSPYQRVDVFSNVNKEGKTVHWLYLNGSLLYGSRGLHEHNLFVSILPNLVLGRATNALVIAGGSLDNARYLAPRVGHLRMVELDETVVRLTREFIQEPRGGFPTNWDLTIDDGKHFLGTWQGPQFDVISVDVPIPSYIQTAMLHSDRFFALARSRLAPGGIFSISLSGELDERDPDPASGASFLSHRVMAGLAKNFRHVTVVRHGDRDFAWASDADLGLTAPRVKEAIDRLGAELGDDDPFGRPDVELLDEGEARRRAARFEPIGEADMQVVLRLSLNKLYRKYYEPRD